MEWLLAHSGDETLDEPFTEEEAGEMKVGRTKQWLAH